MKSYAKVFSAIFLVAILGIASIFVANGYVKRIGSKNIMSSQDVEMLDNIDCIVVLGCLVKNNGKPSDMLGDRLKQGVSLYKQGVADKIIMSGDHGTKEYDEVNAMKQYAISEVVSS